MTRRSDSLSIMFYLYPLLLLTRVVGLGVGERSREQVGDGLTCNKIQTTITSLKKCNNCVCFSCEPVEDDSPAATTYLGSAITVSPPIAI
jgi:hypothetical protein